MVEAGVLGEPEEPPLAPATGTCTCKPAVLETTGVLVEGVAAGLRAGSWDMGGGRYKGGMGPQSSMVTEKPGKGLFPDEGSTFTSLAMRSRTRSPLTTRPNTTWQQHIHATQHTTTRK